MVICFVNYWFLFFSNRLPPGSTRRVPLLPYTSLVRCVIGCVVRRAVAFIGAVLEPPGYAHEIPNLSPVRDMFPLAFAEHADPVPVAVFLPFVIVTLAAIIRADRQQGDLWPRVDFSDPAADLELGEVDHAQIGRAHVCTPVPNAQLVYRL